MSTLLWIAAVVVGLYLVGRWLLFRLIAILIMWYSRNV